MCWGKAPHGGLACQRSVSGSSSRVACGLTIVQTLGCCCFHRHDLDPCAGRFCPEHTAHVRPAHYSGGVAGRQLAWLMGCPGLAGVECPSTPRHKDSEGRHTGLASGWLCVLVLGASSGPACRPHSTTNPHEAKNIDCPKRALTNATNGVEYSCRGRNSAPCRVIVRPRPFGPISPASPSEPLLSAAFLLYSTLRTGCAACRQDHAPPEVGPIDLGRSSVSSCGGWRFDLRGPSRAFAEPPRRASDPLF